MRALLLLPIAALASAIPRVKRQWGPADFYHFEQWVNYINRPRQEFSGDAPGYQTGAWGNFERNVQPHQAPPGWRLEQGNGHWGLIPAQNGYGFPMRPQVVNRPPVVIETNVFRTNKNRYFPTEAPYVTPPVVGSETRLLPTTSTTTEAPTTTTTIPTTTTEDERERFIQTAVREDMDRVLERMGPTESTDTTTSTTPFSSPSSESTVPEVDTSSTTSAPVSGFAAELPALTTSSSSENTESGSLPPQTTAGGLASGFASLDYNAVWSEENNTQAISSTPVVPVESTSEEPGSTFVAKMEEITPSFTETPTPSAESTTVESSTVSETSSSLMSSSETAETQTEPTKTGTSFLIDLFPGLRAPPLPVDIAKKLQEMGVAIEKQL